MNDKGLFSDEFLDMMSVIGFAIGLYNLQLNEKSLSNDDLAREIQANRDKLDEQNDIYMKEILKNQKIIINLLKGGKYED